MFRERAKMRERMSERHTRRERDKETEREIESLNIRGREREGSSVFEYLLKRFKMIEKYSTFPFNNMSLTVTLALVISIISEEVVTGLWIFSYNCNIPHAPFCKAS